MPKKAPAKTKPNIAIFIFRHIFGGPPGEQNNNDLPFNSGIATDDVPFTDIPDEDSIGQKELPPYDDIGSELNINPFGTEDSGNDIDEEDLNDGINDIDPEDLENNDCESEDPDSQPLDSPVDPQAEDIQNLLRRKILLIRMPIKKSYKNTLIKTHVKQHFRQTENGPVIVHEYDREGPLGSLHDVLHAPNDEDFRSKSGQVEDWMQEQYPSMHGLHQHDPHFDPKRDRTTDPIEHTHEVMDNVDTTGLSPEERHDLRAAALFHDLGKMRLPLSAMHPWISTQMAEHYLDQHEDLSPDRKKLILKLVLLHDKLGHIAQNSNKEFSKIDTVAAMAEDQQTLDLLHRITVADVGSIRGLAWAVNNIHDAYVDTAEHMDKNPATIAPAVVPHSFQHDMPKESRLPAARLKTWFEGNAPPNHSLIRKFATERLASSDNAWHAYVSGLDLPGQIHNPMISAWQEDNKSYLGGKDIQTGFHDRADHSAEAVKTALHALQSKDPAKDPYTVALATVAQEGGGDFGEPWLHPTPDVAARANSILKNHRPWLTHVVAAIADVTKGAYPEPEQERKEHKPYWAYTPAEKAAMKKNQDEENAAAAQHSKTNSNQPSLFGTSSSKKYTDTHNTHNSDDGPSPMDYVLGKVPAGPIKVTSNPKPSTATSSNSSKPVVKIDAEQSNHDLLKDMHFTNKNGHRIDGMPLHANPHDLAGVPHIDDATHTVAASGPGQKSITQGPDGHLYIKVGGERKKFVSDQPGVPYSSENLKNHPAWKQLAHNTGLK